MRLDLSTLLLATAVTTAMVGVLFLLSWSQARHERALAIWGAAHLGGSIAATGLALRRVIPDWLSIGPADMVMIGAFGLVWSGVRAFEGRTICLPLALSGGVAFGAACCVPAFYASVPARVILASAAAAAFCTAGAYEIWRAREEALVSRYPAMLLLAAYGVFYAARIPAALFEMPTAGAEPLDSPWVAALCFAGMLFTIGIAFTFMALTKERTERAQRLAALTDPLTGIANRRAFVAEAEALLGQGRACALLLFDLDHFKAVNDTYGHLVGDGVLVGFCTVGRVLLPKGAPFGRLGGEEFACLIPDLSPEAARAEAARIVRTVAAMRLPDLPDLRVGVSVGIAGSAPAGRDFDALMRRADAALYRAKQNGRNRTELAEPALRRAG